MNDIIIGLILSALLFAVAVCKKTLTLPATVTAVAITMCICICTGWREVAFLLFSYIIIVIIDSVGKNAIDKKVRDVHEKTGARKVSQIIANGLFATLCAVVYKITTDVTFHFLYFICVTEACGDSIASDVGVLSKHQPINILTLKKVPAGISGGVSLLGFGASLLGCFVMALAGSFCVGLSIKNLFLITLIPFLGVITDSVLGAAFQAKYKCSVCDKATEKSFHCNQPTVFCGGLRFISNSAVNIITNLLTAVIGYIICKQVM